MVRLTDEQLTLLGLEWQVLGLQDTRLGVEETPLLLLRVGSRLPLKGGLANLLRVELLLLGCESRLLGELHLDPVLRRGRRL